MLGLPGTAAPASARPAEGSSASSAPESFSPAPVKSEEAAAPKRPIAQKTIMGMTSPFVAGIPAPLHPQKTAEPKISEAPAAARSESAPAARSFSGAPASPLEATNRTVMGVAPPESVVAAIRAANAQNKAQPEPKSEPAPERAAPPAAPVMTPPASKNLQRTMVGMAAPSLAATSADKPRDFTPPSQEQRPAQLAPPSTATTPMAQPPAPPAPAGTPENKLAARSDRTMLGVAAAMPSDPPRTQASTESSSNDAGRASFTPPASADRPYSFGSDSDAFPVAPGGASSGPMRAILAALAGAFVVLALGLTVWHFVFGGPNLSVAVVQSEDGEALLVKVPDAAPTTKVRFVGTELPLKNGEARFPLAADALALGDNEITVGVVNGEQVDSSTVRLHVAYRARVDLAGLSRTPSTLAVIIDTLPGAKVTLDGSPLPLDAKGHGQRDYPIAAQSDGKLAFLAKYKVASEDGDDEGSLSLNLPVSSLQIDRPGPSVITDQPSIEVAGAVESAATVTIDGATVKLNDGRFLSRVKLPKAGEYTVHVVARVNGKVPRALDLKISRVTDLTLAAASFKPDSSLTYARIAQNPVIYRGQNVAFDGRVYNVEVKGGASHLQMLVRDCPGTQRCPLWVELPQATDATVDSWVRVLGSVAGEQQFRSERGQVHTVPSVKAQFVLKLAR